MKIAAAGRRPIDLRSVTVQTHFAAVKLCLPGLLQGNDVIDTCRRSGDFKYAHQVIARIADPQRYVSAVSTCDICLPPAKKSVFAVCRSDIMFARSWTGEKINTAAGAQNFLPRQWHRLYLTKRSYQHRKSREYLLSKCTC